MAYLQASGVAAYAQGITNLNIGAAITFEKVNFRQRADAMHLAELKQAQAEGHSSQTSTHDVHPLA